LALLALTRGLHPDISRVDVRVKRPFDSRPGFQ